MLKISAAYFIKWNLAAFLACFLSLALCSCAISSKKNNSNQQGSLIVVPDNIKDKIGSFEVKSISTANFELLSKYPTLFEVGSMDGKASFDRMLFFFQNYSSSYQPQNIHSEIKNLTIQSSSKTDKVVYKVSRQLQGFNIKYAVSAADKGNPKRSAILAANLARFIREGHLDLELIKSIK